MPISQNTYTVPNNFVQQYDLGQKKIRADLVDENFTDAAGAINQLLTEVADGVVHLTGAETVSGNKTFSGNNTFSGDNTFTGSVDLSSATLSSDATFSGDVSFTGDVDLSNANVEGADFVPVGTIIWSANATVPAGYLLCNGAAVGRATYPELFAAIGTAFGSGDGSTTFNLPNLIDRFIEGSNVAGTVKAAGLPEIVGDLALETNAGAQNSGAFSVSTTQKTVSTATAATASRNYSIFKASDSSPIYGSSTTVQPPAITALPCIKAFAAVIGDATVVAGQLVNEIQSKVALDGSNTSSIGSTLSTYMAHAAMPDFNHIITVSSLPYTAPADGWLRLSVYSNSVHRQVTILYDGEVAFAFSWDGASNTMSQTTLLPITKGTNVTVPAGDVGGDVTFIYANGAYSA